MRLDHHFKLYPINKNNFSIKYRIRLSNMPAPGGNGCHSAILGAANLGAMAGLTPDQVHSDIRNAIPPGRRKVSDREIQEAVLKAFSDQKKSIFLPNGDSYHRYKPTKNNPDIHNGNIVLQNIIKQGFIAKEADLSGLSPIPLNEEKIFDTTLFLITLYNPNELIWMGDRCEPGIMGRNIRYVSDWIKFIHSKRRIPPFFIINPLSGKSVKKKTEDGETYRGDRNIQTFKYALVEFDNLTHEDQIRFWSAVKLPIRSLVHTGGKSIHALLDIQKIAKIENLGEWKSKIKNELYDRLLTPIGVDAACSNPARLSRVPGHYRKEKDNYQRIVWLSPEGRSVSL